MNKFVFVIVSAFIISAHCSVEPECTRVGAKGQKGQKGMSGGGVTEDDLDDIWTNLTSVKGDLDDLRDDVYTINRTLWIKVDDIHDRVKVLEDGFTEITTKIQGIQQNLTDAIHDIKYNCPGVLIDLPNDADPFGDSADYIYPIPPMDELTICFWITANSLTNAQDGVYSYYGTGEYFFRIDVDDDEILVRVNGVLLARFDFNGDEKKHICIKYDPVDGVEYYVDGVFVEGDPDVNGVIPGSGNLRIGQRNGGSGDVDTRHFSGSISNLLVWPRCLTAEEIADVCNECWCPCDIAIKFTVDRIAFNGEATYSNEAVCPSC